MPDILPKINNEPPQGIQSILEVGYIWNQDVANELIDKLNTLLARITGGIVPYSQLASSIVQYTPCYYGDGVYVAASDIEARPVEFNPAQWILIATKGTKWGTIEGDISEQADLKEALDSLQEAITAEEQARINDDELLDDKIATIDSKIPENASETNKLVTQEDIPEQIEYSAGTGIEITPDHVINNTQTSAEWGKIEGDINDQADLLAALEEKADATDVEDLRGIVNALEETVESKGTITITDWSK